ncbi:hypothetical protein ACFY4C_37335 [Actinomadura viridis]|uniref:hypothetical protein n=1 Tax=Actinomadura viridis TaxID=58110 RepID=UPI0036C2503A
MQVLIEATSKQVDTGTGEVLAPAADSMEAVWKRIEAVVPRREPAAGRCAEGSYRCPSKLTPSPGTRRRTIVLSSRRCGGVTTTVSQLGVALAQLHRRNVAVIDAGFDARFITTIAMPEGSDHQVVEIPSAGQPGAPLSLWRLPLPRVRSSRCCRVP